MDFRYARDVSQTPTLGNHEMLMYVLALTHSQATSSVGDSIRTSRETSSHVDAKNCSISSSRRDERRRRRQRRRRRRCRHVLVIRKSTRAHYTWTSQLARPRRIRYVARSALLRHENDPAHNQIRNCRISTIAYVVPKYLADMIRNEDAPAEQTRCEG